MDHPSWKKHLSFPKDTEAPWELFHENSKIGRFSETLSKEDVLAHMEELHESLPYEGYPVVPLSRTLSPLGASLDGSILSRESIRNLFPKPLSLDHLTCLLHYGYGVTREGGDGAVRSFRVVPSGGALYPLELYVYSSVMEGQKPGLYHYNPSHNHLRLLREGDVVEVLSARLVQPEIGRNASAVLFITAIFERSVFKYQDRGYRFALLEAGHVAQNINLVATALDFASVNIGGYFDREIDEFLGIDGIAHSTIYMMAIGGIS